MSIEDDVIAANEAFYRAFASADYGAMQAIWTMGPAASCIHPGWPPVHGRDKVLETWRGILSQPPSPPIRALEPTALIHGDSAVVICFEAIGRIFLSASNLFVREGEAWRLVHHQSGQTEKIPKSLSEQISRTVH